MHILNISRLYGIVGPGIDRLSGKDMANMGCIENAWLSFDNGIITGFGAMSELSLPDGAETLDARGCPVLPSFCDSHTHIVYALPRQREFVDKIMGLSYAEIARRGGGILNSALDLARMPESELLAASLDRAKAMQKLGTAAIEIKTGYGLTTESELKMLRVAAAVRESIDARVKITFLGAHAVPATFAGRQDDYVDHVVDTMLPAIAAEGIAHYVDVFCDEGFFTPQQTAKILEAGARYGLKPKIHANELACSGGVQVGVRHNAVSVDHLEAAGDEETALLAQSSTIATMLPGASFFSRLPYAPARKAIDAGATVALASDCNPGSSPNGDMHFVMALGCIQMGMLPQEALAACTINGAAAMELGSQCGAIATGRDASFFITRPMPDLAYFPYAYSEPLVDTVFIRGKQI